MSTPGPDLASGDAATVESAGQFRIYLGAAAGVGKTYAMLSEGRLAHTNVPGSGRNGKRWQNVLGLLAAGVDVITTVNIQHLESIADEVEHMTGARVRERVPDWVVRKADQIELVDSSPEQLRRRMTHGNIYPEARVAQALTNFFRTDNLTALRELALRFLADEADEDLLEHLRGRESGAVWETCERVMVAVTPVPGTDALIRRAARMASRLKADLDVVHVAASDATRPADRPAVAKLSELAADVGARWHEIADDDPARAIARFAGEHQITQIVIGSSRRSRWQQLTGGGSNVTRVIREADPLGIDVHVIAFRRTAPGPAAGAGR